MESVGQRLKKEREARYLTLEKASEATRIRVVFLQALEADDYSALPSATQGRGFLRNYADYLGLNLEEIIAEIQKNAPPPAAIGPLPEVNLIETEIPIAVEEEEPAARGLLTGWLERLRRKDSQPEAETQFAEEPPLVEESQPEVEDQLRAGWLSKIAGYFQSRRAESEPQVESVVEMAGEEPAPFVPLLPADKIFAEIGDKLRQRRELISLTVEEVERHTKLRAAFVRALEAGDHKNLPSPVQTRGMLANYATFLDMDADAIMLRFADGLQARRHEKYAETPREKIQTEITPTMPRLRSFIAGDLVFGLAMIAVLAGLAIWGVRRILTQQEEKPAPTAPSIVDVLGEKQPTQPVGLTFAPVGTSTPTLDLLLAQAETPTFASSANVVVEVYTLKRAFVRVAVDGKVAFEGRLAPQERRIFEANDQVMVLTGDGSALRIRYNGADLGLMGNVGEVVNRIYLITGVATPTATVSPTPTQTPVVTITPTPTQTPSFTPPSP